MNYKKLLLVASALVVIGAASIKPAMAYFTDYTTAVGSKEIKVHDSELTPPTDYVDKDLIKHVAITNTGDFDVYVRVKALCPEGFSVAALDKTSEGWTYNKDGYFYYDSIVKNKNAEDGKTTSELMLQINIPENNNDDFNVIIVQEATKVHYKADGTPYADWNEKIVVQETAKPATSTGSTTNTENSEQPAPETPEENTVGGDN